MYHGIRLPELTTFISLLNFTHSAQEHEENNTNECNCNK